ncbi:general stress protein [Massilia sp. Root418]|uniref:pyridoxamine 5'-phosphate oxidase family protein n=1 Tax=Massilia sp. Root418 TaxID=1736532 RepID=UPI0006F85A4B|nr:pyridoxamine 5'-phosphate oxidase family protein [Massilia sp. Root418]KQW87387.1 general stress protein [Massilia sp. Root418]
MDSINRNQPEHNRQDLTGSEAVKRIKDTVEEAKAGFFCTANRVIPMSPLKVDEAGNLWFLSADDSHHNQDIAANPAVRLYFQGSHHSGFLYFDGHAVISRDPAMIKELWSFTLKTWFTEGENDPRITVIQVRPVEGYYWDNKHGDAVAGAKMLVGAVVGQTLDDSIEGTIRL